MYQAECILQSPVQLWRSNDNSLWTIVNKEKSTEKGICDIHWTLWFAISVVLFYTSHSTGCVLDFPLRAADITISGKDDQTCWFYIRATPASFQADRITVNTPHTAEISLEIVLMSHPANWGVCKIIRRKKIGTNISIKILPCELSFTE